MDKQRKEQLILLALILFLLVMLPKVLLKKKADNDVQQKINNSEENTAIDISVLTSRPAKINDSLSLIDPSSGQPVIVEPEIKMDINTKDPFDLPPELMGKIKTPEMVLQEGTQDELPKINLRGITWGGKMPVAFIDDKVYKIGDTIGDAKILDIDNKGVYFLYNEKKVLLKIKR